MNARQKAIAQTGVLGFLEHHIYLFALLGLIVFYGLERIVKASHKREQKSPEKETIESGVSWLHIASFALYNGLIGYLLSHPEAPGIQS